MSRAPRPLSFSARALGLALAFAGVAATGMLAGACSDNATTTTASTSTAASSGSTSSGDPCVGGVIVDGVCEGKCDPAKCLPDNTCVGNACVLKCTSERDCAQDGTQDCKPAKEDDTMADIMTCQSNGRAAGFGEPCPFGNKECAGFTACPDGGFCDLKQCGGNPDECVIDMAACGTDKSCTVGKCMNGDACKVSTCKKADCTPSFVCNTTGEGDADAYCTRTDCKMDTDCPGGYECTVEHDPHLICGTTKGNSKLCGTTMEPCIAKADFTKNGATYQEGSFCLLRNVCKKRSGCEPCATDLDCSEIDTQKCITIGTDKRCAKGCGKDSDCGRDGKCMSGSCVPRAGACVTTPKPGFCSPCRTDLDCGDKTSGLVCAETSSLSHERGCFDPTLSATCAVDMDCPASPSGKHGGCLDERWGLAMGDASYHHCYFPAIYSNGQPSVVSCW